VTEQLIEAFRDLLDLVIAATPRVIVGIGLVLLALIAAKIVEIVLRAVLTRVRFDRLVERAGVDKALHRIGIRQQLNQFIPRLAYFLLLFLLARTFADAMGLVAISGAIGSFFSYLPNIVAALLLAVLGTTVGQFAGNAVAHAAEEAGIDFAASLGKVVTGLILFIVLVMAVSQLRIDTEIVRIVISVLLAGAGLAFGLSFGLGTRDVTRNIVAGFYARKIVRVGQTVEVAGAKGIVASMTPTHAILESDGATISVANVAFLDQVTRQD
jgi:hypothetical protein